jgi:hypothetical protein
MENEAKVTRNAACAVMHWIQHCTSCFPGMTFSVVRRYLLSLRRHDAISTVVVLRAGHNEHCLHFEDNLEWKLDCCFRRQSVNRCTSQWSDLEGAGKWLGQR